jgi:hypothetical protein
MRQMQSDPRHAVPETSTSTAHLSRGRSAGSGHLWAFELASHHFGFYTLMNVWASRPRRGSGREFEESPDRVSQLETVGAVGPCCPVLGLCCAASAVLCRES